MAYTVGSASVDIVPDFRGAQLAITAWFAKQQNELRIPVKPDMSPEASRQAEEQAKKTGTRVGKAMADATEKQMEASRQRELRAQERLGEAMARDVAKATAKAIADRARQQERAQAEELRAQQRLGAAMARDYERHLTDRQRADERALREQQRLGAEMAREIERAINERTKAEERAAAAAASIRAREEAARERDAERSLQAVMRDIEREAAEREKVMSREREKLLREEEKYGERSARAALKAIDDAIREGNREKIQIEIDKRQAILEGRTAGGLVARAIKQELHQNAGLITAAVTGALTVGGGAVAVGVTALFAGAGAAGAFQSQKLRDTWVETFDDIRIAGVYDASVLGPAFERMAGTIGGSFERMRPQIRDTFTALEPQLDMFSDSLANTAENLVPGLMRSIQGGQPVMRGFGNLMEDLGQGTTDFLDNITDHAPAAGQSLSALGGATGELLPLLGELLGEGAELGTIVLPVMTAALGGARSVVESLGGSLPILATGFLAFRTIQGSARFVNQFSQGLLNLAPNVGVYTERLTRSATAGERMMSATGRVSGAAAAFGRALPAVGVAVGGLAMILAASKQDTDDYANSLMKGGAAARQALVDMGDESLWGGIKTGLSNFFDADMWQGATALELRTEDAREAIQKLEASMSPLELAQSRLAGWTETLAFRLSDENSSAEDVAIAQRKVAEYTARSAAEQENLESAVRGVTEAMLEQADQARARVDSEFGYQQSILDVQEAHEKLISTLNDEEASSGDVAQAMLDYNKALGDQAAAAGERAMSNLPASMDDAQKAILGAKGSLDELNAMIAMGMKLPPELEQYRQQLINITGEADGAKLAQAQLVSALGEVGFAVAAIPGTKAVVIDAPTDELKTRLLDLGFYIQEMPDGSIEVKAVTDEAKDNLGNLSTLLTEVDQARPEPIVDANVDPAMQEAQRAQRELQILGGQRPKPVADLEGGPFNGNHQVIIDRIRELARQRPTPVVDADPTPFNNTARDVLARGAEVARMRPNPIISAIDNASSLALRVKGIIDSLRDKTITITTLQQGRSTMGGDFAADGGAMEGGRFHPIYRFDRGGAVVGRGGPRDDLVPARGPNPFADYYIGNGEHILDGRDVALMGGQAGVYAFREMLNAGAFSRASSGPSQSTGIRQMVSVSAGQSAAPARPSSPPRSVSLYTPDIPTALRELKAQEHQDAVLAAPWP